MMKNDYINGLLQSKNLQILPENIRDSLLTEARLMSDLGVENEDDHVQFLIVLQHTPDVLSQVFPAIPKDDQETVSKVAAKVFANRGKRPIDSLINLMLAIAEAASSLGLAVHKEAVEKWAYPQGFEGNEPRPAHDLNKWMRATRDIYLKVQQGQTQAEAERSVTKDWDKMENIDYHNWLKLYRERVPDKYPKLANFYVSDQSPGMYIPNPIDFSSLKGQLPHPLKEEKEPEPEPEEDVSSARDQIESQRAKIVSRLNAAERLLASMEGQFFAGNDQELMLKLLQDLKRKVQTANKITVKSTLFEDYIYRTANMLRSQGRMKAGNFFEKIAMPPLGAPPDPLGDPLAMGAPTGGAPGGEPPVPGEGGGNAEEDTKKAFQEFFDGLNKRFPGDDDDTRRERRKREREERKNRQAPAPEAPAAPPAPPQTAPSTAAPQASPATASADDGDIVVYAQMAGVPPEPIGAAETAGPPAPRSRPLTSNVAPPAPLAEPKKDEEITVTDKETVVPDDKTDDVIDAALKEVTVDDVIRRLEMLVSIYNQREISRQINILDIMMDRIGLASFFPSLAEAMGKAIESGNYISTRLEDILTKLKGSATSVQGQEWLEPQRNPESAETATVREGLEKQQEEEELRKAKRRERELAKAKGEVPEGGAGATAAGELAAPAEMPAAPARPIATR